MVASKAKGDKGEKTEGEVETTKDTVAIVNESKDKGKEGEDKDKKKEGVRLFVVPRKPKPLTGKDKNKVEAAVTAPSGGGRDADDMELGAEAATMKKEGKRMMPDEDEEKDKVIEVHVCWPLFCAKR